MKLLLIGYDLAYQPIKTFQEGFLELGYQVDFIRLDKNKLRGNTDTFTSRYVTRNELVYKDPIEIDGTGYDYVLVGNTTVCFKILNCEKVVYYHSEKTWYPSCINPTYLFSPFPENDDFFARYYPHIIKDVEEFGLINYPVNRKKYRNLPKQSNMKESDYWDEFQLKKMRKEGLYYMGNLHTQDTKTWWMRTIYDFKFRIAAQLKEMGLLNIIHENYQKGIYQGTMQNWSLGLVVNGSGCYNSYRPYEYAVNGVIPVFVLKKNDFYPEKKYLNQFGFYNIRNCFIIDEIELNDLNSWIEGYNTKAIRKNLLALSKQFDVLLKIKEMENIIFNNKI